MAHWDVVIVGGGPSGNSAAYDLASEGYKTLILEKKAFPRTKSCAGGLTIKALAKLRFSVAHLIQEKATVLSAGYKTQKLSHLNSKQPICAFVIRKEFDTYCLQKAQDQGAQLELIKGLSEIEQTSEGVCVITDGGVRHHTRYLVGADGAHSQVRKLTGSFVPDRTAIAVEGLLPRHKVSTEHLSQSEKMTLDFGAQKLGYGWLFPKKDHVNVGLFTYLPQQAKLSKAMLANYAKERLGSSEFTEVHGFPIATGGEFYRPREERVFLVGDAAGMAEPLLGEGIHNAIATGQAVAKSIIESDETNAQAKSLYQSNIKDIQQDLMLSRRIAPWFYRMLPLAYGVLIRYPLAPVFMNGFAAGMTLKDCRDAFGKFKTEFDVPDIHSLKTK